MSQNHAAAGNSAGGADGGAGSELAAIFAKRRSHIKDTRDNEEKDGYCGGVSEGGELAHQYGDDGAGAVDDDYDDYYGENFDVGESEEKSADHDGRMGGGGGATGQWNATQSNTVGALSNRIGEKIGSSSAGTPPSLSTTTTAKRTHAYGVRAKNFRTGTSPGGDENAGDGNDIIGNHYDAGEVGGSGVLGAVGKNYSNNISSSLTSVLSKKRVGTHQWIVAPNDEESSVVSAITLQSALVAVGGNGGSRHSPPHSSSPPANRNEDATVDEDNSSHGDEEEEEVIENNFLAQARRGLRRAANAHPDTHFPTSDAATLSPQIEQYEEDEEDEEEKKGEHDDNDNNDEVEASGTVGPGSTRQMGVENSNAPHFSFERQRLPKAGQQQQSSVLNRWSPKSAKPVATTTPNNNEGIIKKNGVVTSGEERLSTDNTSRSPVDTVTSSNDSGRVGAAPLQRGAAPFSTVNRWNGAKNKIRSTKSSTTNGTHSEPDSIQPPTCKADKENINTDADDPTLSRSAPSDPNTATRHKSDPPSVLASARRWEKKATPQTAPVSEGAPMGTERCDDALASPSTPRSVATLSDTNRSRTNDADASATKAVDTKTNASAGSSVKAAAMMWGKRAPVPPVRSLPQEGQQQQQQQQQQQHESYVQGNAGAASSDNLTRKTTKTTISTTKDPGQLTKNEQNIDNDEVIDKAEITRRAPEVLEDLSLLDRMKEAKSKSSRKRQIYPPESRGMHSSIPGENSGEVGNSDTAVAIQPKAYSAVSKKIHQLTGKSVGGKNAAQAGVVPDAGGPTKERGGEAASSATVNRVGRDPPQEIWGEEDSTSKVTHPRRFKMATPQNPTPSSKSRHVSLDPAAFVDETTTMEAIPMPNTMSVGADVNDDTASVMSSASALSSRSGAARRSSSNEKLLTIAKLSLRRTPRNKEETVLEEENEKYENEEDTLTILSSKPWDEKSSKARKESTKAERTDNQQYSLMEQDDAVDVTNQNLSIKATTTNTASGLVALAGDSFMRQKKKNWIKSAVTPGEREPQREGQSPSSMQGAQHPPTAVSTVTPRVRSKLSQTTKSPRIKKPSESSNLSGSRSNKKRLDELDEVVAKASILNSPMEDMCADPSLAALKQGGLRRGKKLRDEIVSSKKISNAAVVDHSSSKALVAESSSSASIAAKVAPVSGTKSVGNDNSSVSGNNSTPRAGANLSSRRVVKPRWAAALKKRESAMGVTVANNNRGSTENTERKETSPKSETTENVVTQKTRAWGDKGVPGNSGDSCSHQAPGDNNCDNSEVKSTSQMPARNTSRQRGRSLSLSEQENYTPKRDLSVDSITREMRPRDKQQGGLSEISPPSAGPINGPHHLQLKTICNNSLSHEEESVEFPGNQNQQLERADSATESVDSITCEMRVLPKPAGEEHSDDEEEFSQWQQGGATFAQHSANGPSNTQVLQGEFSASFETWEGGWGSSVDGKPFPSPQNSSPAKEASPGGGSSAFEVRTKSVNSVSSNFTGSHVNSVFGNSSVSHAFGSSSRSIGQHFSPKGTGEGGTSSLHNEAGDGSVIVSPTTTELRSENHRLREEVLALRRQLNERDKMIVQLEACINVQESKFNMVEHQEEHNPQDHHPPKMLNKTFMPPSQSSQLHNPLPTSPSETERFQITTTVPKSPGQGVMLPHRRANHSVNDRRFLC